MDNDEIEFNTEERSGWILEMIDETTNEIVGYTLLESKIGEVVKNSTNPLSFEITVGNEVYRKPNTWTYELVSIEDVARGIK
jgi:hypothetical protein